MFRPFLDHHQVHKELKMQRATKLFWYAMGSIEFTLLDKTL